MINKIKQLSYKHIQNPIKHSRQPQAVNNFCKFYIQLFNYALNMPHCNNNNKNDDNNNTNNNNDTNNSNYNNNTSNNK